jgi:hypothetical protein
VSGTFRTQQGYPAALTDLLLAPGQTLKDLNGQRDRNNFFNVAALNTDTRSSRVPSGTCGIPESVVPGSSDASSRAGSWRRPAGHRQAVRMDPGPRCRDVLTSMSFD